MKKIKLHIVGITYSHSQSGSYALILGEEKGTRRLPIIIGNSEAQAIAIKVENMSTPRPLTHDLFQTLMEEFHLMLSEVFIHKLEEGVFYAKLICSDGIKQVEIDSRTSDAIALALRANAPIYTTESILKSAGIVMENDAQDESFEEKTESKALIDNPVSSSSRPDLSQLTIKELNEMLEKAINDEAYERASQIRDELNQRKQGD
jgi:bifunctional DNase/RNase